MCDVLVFVELFRERNRGWDRTGGGRFCLQQRECMNEEASLHVTAKQPPCFQFLPLLNEGEAWQPSYCLLMQPNTNHERETRQTVHRKAATQNWRSQKLQNQSGTYVLVQTCWIFYQPLLWDTDMSTIMAILFEVMTGNDIFVRIWWCQPQSLKLLMSLQCTNNARMGSGTIRTQCGRKLLWREENTQSVSSQCLGDGGS